MSQIKCQQETGVGCWTGSDLSLEMKIAKWGYNDNCDHGANRTEEIAMGLIIMAGWG
jgi:hypothetical protein